MNSIDGLLWWVLAAENGSNSTQNVICEFLISLPEANWQYDGVCSYYEVLVYYFRFSARISLSDDQMA